MDPRNAVLRSAIIDEYLNEKEEKEYETYLKKLQEVYDFSLSVGIVRDILKAKTKLWQLIWFVLACSAVGVCINEVTLLVATYLSNPTNTRITYKVNSSLEFPSITVCTYARVNSTKIKNQQINLDMMTYMLSAFKGMYLFYNQYNIRQRQEALEHEYTKFVDEYTNYNKDNFSLSNFFIMNGLDCEEFLSSCMFQGTDFTCCEKEILSDIGKCFLVRSPQFSEQTIPGPTGGLKMFISNWKDEYPEAIINSNPDMGIQLHIVHPSETAYVGSSPLIIFPQTHAMVRLRPVRQIMLKSRKGDSCTETKSLKYYNTYSYEGCFTECIANMTEKTCGCVQIGSVPEYETLEKEKKICTPSSATSCVQPLLQANNMGFLWDIYDIKENCDCPLPCKQWSYETAVSYSSVPNPGYKKAWSQRTRDNVTKRTSEDYMIVDLFFDNLVYTLIEEKELQDYTIFLSQVGGQLSIWLGIRVITILHLIYYGGMTLCYLLPVWFKKMKDIQSKKIEEVTAMVKRKTTIRRRTNNGTVNVMYQEGPEIADEPTPVITEIVVQTLDKEKEAMSPNRFTTNDILF